MPRHDYSDLFSHRQYIDLNSLLELRNSGAEARRQIQRARFAEMRSRQPQIGHAAKWAQ